VPLREIRRERGLTVEQLAVLAKVNKSTISRAERGLLSLQPETLVRISRALKVPPKRIAEREEAKNPCCHDGTVTAKVQNQSLMTRVRQQKDG